MQKPEVKIGIIGGSGLYNLEGIEKLEEISVDTPFGAPSGKLVVCKLEGREIVFLPRHGAHHQINPTRVNYRANIFGLKKLGVERILSISACGSLKEEFKPLDFVIPSQFVDRTRGRASTFFEEGVVVHAGFARPVCPGLAQMVQKAAEAAGANVHYGGTYINMEGPQFSTLAESNLYRSWGMDIIGMTNMVEAKLAREAEMCYASLAAVTDYDCWHPEHDSVTVETILSNLNKNVENSRKVLRELVGLADQERTCACNEALKYAIVTRPEFIPEETKKKLDILIGKYL